MHQKLTENLFFNLTRKRGNIYYIHISNSINVKRRKKEYFGSKNVENLDPYYLLIL